VFKVSRSGYYNWQKHSPKRHLTDNEKLIPLVRKIHHDSKRTYGTRRMADALKKHDIPCGRYRAGTLMKLANVSVRRRKKFRVTTDSKHNLPVAPNLLNRNFNVKSPNKAWASDITYIWTTEGWLYLSVILDLYSRRVVGWALNNRINKQLVEDALRMAIWHRRPKPGTIFHSDRGSQYCSLDFQKLLKGQKLISSMSRKGDCWDNAVVESFFWNFEDGTGCLYKI
jgi:putative transposase